jgi:parvulin-like peptidyl-prolyl isomerase
VNGGRTGNIVASSNPGTLLKKLLILALLLVSACGGIGSAAATVDGTDITVAQVEANAAGVDGAIDAEAFRAMLRVLVVGQIADAAALAQFQLEPTEEQITAKLEEIKVSVGAADDAAFYQIAADAGFSEEGAVTVSRQQVVRELVTARLLEDAEPLTDADIEAAYQEQLYRFVEEACVSHILLATEEEAVAAKARLDGGDDFATVAAELSTDPSAADNSGDLGCNTLGDYVAEFASAAATAEIGTVTEPVESQFGFHLILVESRTDPTPFADVREELAAQLDSEREGAIFEEWLVTVVEAAQVEIDPEFGSWSIDPEGPTILPPTTAP